MTTDPTKPTLWTRRKWRYRLEGAIGAALVGLLLFALFGCQGFGNDQASITQDGADATATRHTITTPASTTVVEKIDPATGAVVERKTTTTEPSFNDTFNGSAHAPSVQATGTEAARAALNNKTPPMVVPPPLPGEKGPPGGVKGGTGTASASALDWFTGESSTAPLIWFGVLLLVAGIVGYCYLRSSPLALTSPFLKPLAIGFMGAGGALILIGAMLDKITGTGAIVVVVAAMLIAAGIYLVRTLSRTAAAAGRTVNESAATTGTLESAIDAIAGKGPAALRAWLADMHTKAPEAEYQKAMDYVGRAHPGILTGA